MVLKRKGKLKSWFGHGKWRCYNKKSNTGLNFCWLIILKNIFVQDEIKSNPGPPIKVATTYTTFPCPLTSLILPLYYAHVMNRALIACCLKSGFVFWRHNDNDPPKKPCPMCCDVFWAYTKSFWHVGCWTWCDISGDSTF